MGWNTERKDMKRLFLVVALAAMAALQAMAAGGLRLSILGDSYSTFEGWVRPDTNLVWYSAPADARRTDVERVEQTWWHQVLGRLGWRLEANNSYSGSTICNTGYRGEDYTHESFVTRVGNLGSPDVIIVFGATNDSWAGSPLGEFKYEGIEPADLYSFRPAMAYMLARLKELYPGARLWFVLNDGLKPEVGRSATAICARYGVPVIKLKGISKKSGHPDIEGMRQIADQVCAALE